MSRDNCSDFKPSCWPLEASCLSLFSSIESIKAFVFVGDSQFDFLSAKAFSLKFNIPYEFINVQEIQ